MRILVDIGHPADVHLFRHAVAEWRARGHEVLITARDKDVAFTLLDHYGLDYISTGRAKGGIVAGGFELLGRLVTFGRIISRFRPDVMIGHGGPGWVHVGWLRRIPSFLCADTEHARLNHVIALPFATKICTPACYKDDLGPKQVRYNGSHQLAYLHPRRYTPSPATLVAAGIEPEERFFLVRFVAWKATHDVGYQGFSTEGKKQLVRALSQIGRVIITSESPLPQELEPYRMSLSPTAILDLLYYSSLYVGEGGTMASEAAVLGTPAIYVNPLTMGYIEEEEAYGLLHRIVDEQQAIQRAVELARDETAKEAYRQRRERLLEDKVDVTAWLVDFVIAGVE